MPVTEALTRYLKSTDIIPAAGQVGGEWLDHGSTTTEVDGSEMPTREVSSPSVNRPSPRTGIATFCSAKQPFPRLSLGICKRFAV